MKIDLYNNTETFIKESRQNRVIKEWAFRKGISVDYLKDHPCMQDVLFLLEFRDEFQKEYNTNKLYAASFNGYWSVVYVQKKPLKEKAFRKFETMALDCLAIRQQQQSQRQKIKLLRN